MSGALSPWPGGQPFYRAQENARNLRQRVLRAMPGTRAAAEWEPPQAASTRAICVAGLLERIRVASDDFTLPDWACNSYNTLFSELKQLESDVFTHVHLENHVLRPRFAA